ncbi:heavy-metal-associated domain-containing protein [Alteripontixanthobacter maritimus]|nr:heavy-metal-associated domain-containing protein [Alteripontixanthobacter maritimus]
MTIPYPFRRQAFLAIACVVASLAAFLGARMLLAQVSGDRGIAPVVASADIAVGGIDVDVTGDTLEEARVEGWRQAQSLAWKKLDGPNLSDSQIESIVSAVVVEREQLGANRYIARLGVIFDRQRAGRYLGRQGARSRSAPMLLVPVTFSAGTQTVYEMRNPWQRAWAEYQAGSSRISYVRPSGAGGDSLLINYGQVGRRSRAWWRNILDQFGATDVLVPIANLRYQYPGGPIEGTFVARYGPDSKYLASFSLTARNQAALPGMLEDAVGRFDDIFEEALADGKLRPDLSLSQRTGEAAPAIRELIEAGRQAGAQERANAAAEAARRRAAEAERTRAAEPEPTPTPTPTATANSYVVQFATPDARALDTTLAAVRAAPGVRGASVTSTAIGGTSVMNVTFEGSLGQLAGALRARSFAVRQGPTGLGISR